jgi:hypothetical protein
MELNLLLETVMKVCEESYNLVTIGQKYLAFDVNIKVRFIGTCDIKSLLNNNTNMTHCYFSMVRFFNICIVDRFTQQYKKLFLRFYSKNV